MRRCALASEFSDIVPVFPSSAGFQPAVAPKAEAVATPLDERVAIVHLEPLTTLWPEPG
jgi:hypothetical protein